MDFDPDKYLEDFDPDQYLAEEKPKEPWIQAGPLTIEKSPLEVDWFEAAKNELTKPAPAGSMSVASNPLLTLSSSPSAALGVASKAASVARPAVISAAERFATSPVPQRVSEATNVVGLGKGVLGNLGRALVDKMSPTSKAVMDAVSGVVGRKAAYSNPYTAVPQAISDASLGVTKVQKGVGWLLDNAPEKLGRYAPVLKQAAQRGTQALATTSFLLSQSDPEYQKIIKDEQESQR